MRLRLLFFSTILRFGGEFLLIFCLFDIVSCLTYGVFLVVEVFCGDWQDHWELPVLYQDCEKTEPCCWKTYEGFIKQYNSLM